MNSIIRIAAAVRIALFAGGCCLLAASAEAELAPAAATHPASLTSRAGNIEDFTLAKPIYASDSAAGADVSSNAAAAPSETVYAPPEQMAIEQQTNNGGVHFEFAIGYFTDYIFRGVEILEPPGPEDRLNVQFFGKTTFDLGPKVPHPFVSVFVNVSESDPVSNFQEIRPTFGFDWTIRPIKLSGGNTTYIRPDRDQLETNEVFARIEIDDGYFLNLDKPIFSPYALAVYDYDLYNGYYLEWGIKHDFAFEDTGFVLTAEASMAYESGIGLFQLNGARGGSGFQHYQLGLIGTYSLNSLLNISPRLGEWDVQGFMYYTDGIDNDQRATTQTWGGVGISFRY